jgi:hypothetical protein
MGPGRDSPTSKRLNPLSVLHPLDATLPETKRIFLSFRRHVLFHAGQLRNPCEASQGECTGGKPSSDILTPSRENEGAKKTVEPKMRWWGWLAEPSVETKSAGSAIPSYRRSSPPLSPHVRMSEAHPEREAFSILRAKKIRRLGQSPGG